MPNDAAVTPMFDRATLATIRADFPIFAHARAEGQPLVYLDSAASAQKPQAMLDRMTRFYSQEYANIHRGVYPLAEAATAAFEGARTTVARFINANEPAEIVFVRNTTEAVNLVAHSYARATLRPGDAILLTELEHHSNLVAWQIVARACGAELRFIPIDEECRHDLSNLDALLKNVKIVAFSQISNAFGTVAPSKEIIRAAHAVGAVAFVDGAQSAPHQKIDVQALGADFFVASGHKLCGPTGIGFLWARRALLEAMPPFLTGGDMIATVAYRSATFNTVPWKFEAGTSAFAEAVALAASIDYLENIGLDRINNHEHGLAELARLRLAELAPLGLKMYGPLNSGERSGIISFTFADIHPHDIASLLASDGVCIRAGHHCNMPLMNRLNLTATARASFYLYNGEDDVDALVGALQKAARIFKLG